MVVENQILGHLKVPDLHLIQLLKRLLKQDIELLVVLVIQLTLIPMLHSNGIEVQLKVLRKYLQVGSEELYLKRLYRQRPYQRAPLYIRVLLILNQGQEEHRRRPN